MKGDTVFQKVVIIGYGKITGEIITYVTERRKEYGYQPEVIEHEVHSFSITEKLCMEYGIPFARIEDKKELTAYFDSFSERTLIVSASNNFLFPKKLVEKENLTIINFHNALLPAYPGRNAPSWVIFMGEKETGITWHYVTAGVDEGNIIIQKTCEIGPDTKAYELAEKLMDLACEGYFACFDAVLEEGVEAKAQELLPERKLYRATQMPGDGFLDLGEEPEKIYRLLRSVDYGKSGIFPPLQTEVAGKQAEILRYRKVAPEKKKEGADMLYLPFADGELLKIKYRLL